MRDDMLAWVRREEFVTYVIIAVVVGLMIGAWFAVLAFIWWAST